MDRNTPHDSRYTVFVSRGASKSRVCVQGRGTKRGGPSSKPGKREKHGEKAARNPNRPYKSPLHNLLVLPTKPPSAPLFARGRCRPQRSAAYSCPGLCKNSALARVAMGKRVRTVVTAKTGESWRARWLGAKAKLEKWKHPDGWAVKTDCVFEHVSKSGKVGL